MTRSNQNVPAAPQDVGNPLTLRRWFEDVSAFLGKLQQALNLVLVDEIVSVSSGFTIDTDPFRWYKVDATAAPVTVVLPSAAKAKNKVIGFKKIDASANAMIIDGAGAELIDGSATQSTTTQYATFTIVSDGTGWNIY